MLSEATQDPALLKNFSLATGRNTYMGAHQLPLGVSVSPLHESQGLVNMKAKDLLPKHPLSKSTGTDAKPESTPDCEHWTQIYTEVIEL